MDNTTIKAMNKFNYLNEYGDTGHDYDKKHHRKQANRIERHITKNELSRAQKTPTRHIVQ